MWLLWEAVPSYQVAASGQQALTPQVPLPAFSLDGQK